MSASQIGKKKAKSGKGKSNSTRKLLKGLVTVLLQSLIGALFLATLFFCLSYFIFHPQPKVQISEQGYSGGNILAYKIIMSNPSNMNIYNLEFSVRFDEMHPITNYHLEEPFFKTGILLRTSEDFELTERKGNRIIWVRLF